MNNSELTMTELRSICLALMEAKASKAKWFYDEDGARSEDAMRIYNKLRNITLRPTAD